MCPPLWGTGEAGGSDPAKTREGGGGVGLGWEAAADGVRSREGSEEYGVWGGGQQGAAVPAAGAGG